MAKMAGLLQALPRNMAYGLKALIDQKVANGEEAPAPAAEAEPEVAEDTSGSPEEQAHEAVADEAPTDDGADPSPEAEAHAAAEDAEPVAAPADDASETTAEEA